MEKGRVKMNRGGGGINWNTYVLENLHEDELNELEYIENKRIHEEEGGIDQNRLNTFYPTQLEQEKHPLKIKMESEKEEITIRAYLYPPDVMPRFDRTLLSPIFEPSLDELASRDTYQIDEKLDVKHLISNFWELLNYQEKVLFTFILYKHSLIDLVTPTVSEEMEKIASEKIPDGIKFTEIAAIEICNLTKQRFRSFSNKFQQKFLRYLNKSRYLSEAKLCSIKRSLSLS
jgi:hypothetical protein